MKATNNQIMAVESQEEKMHHLLHQLGRVHIQKRQFQEAFDKLGKALSYDPDNSVYLHDLAVAAIGLGDVSPQRMQLYQKASACNGDSRNLHIGLATLFVHKSISTDFAISLCEKAIQFNPANAQKIRFFLKKYYEATGNKSKSRQIEHDVVLNTNDRKLIRAYLDELRWAGEFAEADKALSITQNQNGKSVDTPQEKILNIAYEKVAQNSMVVDPAILQKMAAIIEQLDITASLDALKLYLLLRSRMPDSFYAEENEDKVDEWEFILGDASLEKMLNSMKAGKERRFRAGPFLFDKELLTARGRKNRSFQKGEPLARIRFSSKSFAVLRFSSGGANSDIQLMMNRLLETPNSIYQRSGNGFFSIAENPADHIQAVISIFQEVEKINQKMDIEDKLTLKAAVYISENAYNFDKDRLILDGLLKSIHFLGLTKKKKYAAEEGSKLLVTAVDKDIQKLEKDGVVLLYPQNANLLPGSNIDYYNVLWKDPLKDINAQQHYMINRFALKKCLGRNKSYATYLAMDVQLDRPVIVKLLLPAITLQLGQNGSKKNHIFDKLRAVGRITHPNITNLYDMGEHNSMIYFVREYVEGQALLTTLASTPRTEIAILNILYGLVRALQHLQDQGIMHLNMRPQNVWLSDANEIKITDSRIPNFINKIPTMNTVNFLAPEVAEGKGDYRSDIFSVGLIAYGLLAGNLPSIKNFSSTVPIQTTAELSLLINDGWHAIVMKCLEWNPDKRYQNMKALEADLRKMQLKIMDSH